MIEQCNFKNKYNVCTLKKSLCSEEANCIIFQTYNNTILQHDEKYIYFHEISSKLDLLNSNQQTLRKMFIKLKPKRKKLTKAPKKPIKPLAMRSPKDGRYANPNRAIDIGIKQIIKKEK